MGGEKEIEEMAEIITNADLRIICKGQTCLTCEFAEISKNCYTAKALYDAGFHRQEWISVEERLPEQCVPVLVYKNSNSEAYGDMETAYFEKGRWRGSCGEFITHWMPLPKAPKVKGGKQE